MLKAIILAIFIVISMFGIFLVVNGAREKKANLVEINRLLDKIEKNNKEILEMLDRRAGK